jgi:hypothetical protein
VTEPSADLDVAELRSDIRERVAEARACDYCGAALDLGQPVMYDVIRVADLPNLEQLFDLPTGWFPDASRCQQCERDTLAPATDGFDEALVMVELVELNGVLSIDATSLTPVDVSPDGEGHHPPYVDPRLVSRYGDIGLARWIRVQWLLEHDDGSSATVSVVRQAVEQSPDVPLEVQ